MAFANAKKLPTTISAISLDGLQDQAADASRMFGSYSPFEFLVNSYDGTIYQNYDPNAPTSSSAKSDDSSSVGHYFIWVNYSRTVIITSSNFESLIEYVLDHRAIDRREALVEEQAPHVSAYRGDRSR